MNDLPVVIIGAGPVGLAAGVRLATGYRPDHTIATIDNSSSGCCG